MRWEGDLQAQFSEAYAFHVISDDRARLWINGRLLIDEWENHPETESTALVRLEAGKKYFLRSGLFSGSGQSRGQTAVEQPFDSQAADPAEPALLSPARQRRRWHTGFLGTGQRIESARPKRRHSPSRPERPYLAADLRSRVSNLGRPPRTRLACPLAGRIWISVLSARPAA